MTWPEIGDPRRERQPDQEQDGDDRADPEPDRRAGTVRGSVAWRRRDGRCPAIDPPANERQSDDEDKQAPLAQSLLGDDVPDGPDGRRALIAAGAGFGGDTPGLPGQAPDRQRSRGLGGGVADSRAGHQVRLGHRRRGTARAGACSSSSSDWRSSAGASRQGPGRSRRRHAALPRTVPARPAGPRLLASSPSCSCSGWRSRLGSPISARSW